MQTETKTVRAGEYRYFLQRQIQQKQSNGTVVYVNDAQYWASITDMSSSETATTGAAILQTKVLIRIRNFVTINMSDLLLDSANSYVYYVLGIERSFTNNEMWVLAERKALGLTA